MFCCKSHLIIFSILFLGASGLAAANPLDTVQIKNLLLEGETENVRLQLEQVLKEKEESLSDPEKAFTYKYLGVVNSHHPETKNKAEAYFYSMFRLSPYQNLNDLPVSHRIEEVFGRVKSRFLAKNPQYANQQNDLTKKAQSKPENKSKEKKRGWMLWAGGAGVILTVTAILLLTNDDAEPVTYSVRR